MDEKLLFCVSISCVKKKVYGPEWKETDGSKTLIDLFLQVCGTEILGQQVQVLISKERSFLEAAVVPVCTPLIVLAEKSQSYIQFILKCENVKLEKLFQAQHHKTSHESSLGRQETFCIKTMDKNWMEIVKTKDGNNTVSNNSRTSYYGLASKPSFEDMTVEEICEEIRRIKTTELSSWSKLDVSGKNKCENLGDTAINLNTTVPVIKKSVRNSLKRTPSPVPTLTSKLRSLKSAKAQKKNKSAPNSPVPFPNSPTPARNSPILARNSPTPVKKRAVKNSPTADRKEVKRNESSPMTPNESNGSVLLNASSEEADKPATNTTKKVRQQRLPDTERLSALAQPRRRNSEPIKTSEHTAKKITHSRKSNSPKTKRPSSATTSSRVSIKAKSNFAKPPCTNESKSADYFVDIFTATATSTSERHRKDESYDAIDVKCKYSEYSSDSLLTYSTDKSSEMSVSDVLDELQQNSSPIMKKGPSCNLSQETVNQTSKNDSLEKPERKIISENLSKSFMTSPDKSKSTQPSTDSIDVPALKPSPQKSPLFSSLLEKNHMKHHLSSSSFEKISDTTPLDANLANEASENRTQSSEFLKMNSSANHESLDDDISTDFGLSSDAPVDSLSLSTSSKNNEVCVASIDNSNDLKTDLAWSNSRGIKFTGNNKVENNGNVYLNKTFVISGKSSSESTINRHHSLNLALERRPLANSSPCPSTNALRTTSDGVRTPDKHTRKHWDNSLKGMDELLIASLQAFSIELRSTTENVASNIRVLYEQWRKEHEETDDDDDMTDTEEKNLTEDRLSKISPPPVDAGIQKGIAFVFRNLRKIEVKLKTMEQAAMTMSRTGKEANVVKEQPSDAVTKVPEEKKSMLQRNKSFKWRELKNSARVQARSSTWRQTHPHRNHQDTSSDSDA